MVTIALDGQALHVPATVRSHRGFQKWILSGAVPDEARLHYINNEIWFDPMPEHALFHNRIKTQVSHQIFAVVQADSLGSWFGDGMTLISKRGDFTTVPDGIFISNDSEEKQRATLIGLKGKPGATAIAGVPDLTLEVVSETSVVKDTEWLMSGYWNAGVSEYWLIDARRGGIEFSIHRRTARGFQPARKNDGWLKSNVLGHAFRFVANGTRFGQLLYTFECR